MFYIHFNHLLIKLLPYEYLSIIYFKYKHAPTLAGPPRTDLGAGPLCCARPQQLTVQGLAYLIVQDLKAYLAANDSELLSEKFEEHF